MDVHNVNMRTGLLDVHNVNIRTGRLDVYNVNMRTCRLDVHDVIMKTGQLDVQNVCRLFRMFVQEEHQGLKHSNVNYVRSFLWRVLDSERVINIFQIDNN